MKDSKNVTIALLCVSAAILATVLVLTQVSTPARAEGPVKGGDYIMVTGAYNKNEDLVYIVDIAQQKMNVYHLVIRDRALKLRDQVNLKLAFRER